MLSNNEDYDDRDEPTQRVDIDIKGDHMATLPGTLSADPSHFDSRLLWRSLVTILGIRSKTAVDRRGRRDDYSRTRGVADEWHLTADSKS